MDARRSTVAQSAMRVKQGPAVQAWQIRNNDADMRGSSDQSVEERFELVDRECAWRTGKGLTGVDIGQSFRRCNNGGAKQCKASIGNPIELGEVRTGETWMRALLGAGRSMPGRTTPNHNDLLDIVSWIRTLTQMQSGNGKCRYWTVVVDTVVGFFNSGNKIFIESIHKEMMEDEEDELKYIDDETVASCLVQTFKVKKMESENHLSIPRFHRDGTRAEQISLSHAPCIQVIKREREDSVQAEVDVEGFAQGLSL